jgi:hypothetical protein
VAIQEWEESVRRTSQDPSEAPSLTHEERVLRALVSGVRLDDPDGEILIRVQAIGELTVPTGQVIACDPSRLTPSYDEVIAFERTVPPGRYPVGVSRVVFPLGGERNALATLWLGSTPPVRLELATRPGQDVATLEPGEIFGHGVDTGTSCFIDHQTAREIVERNKDWDYKVRDGGYREFRAVKEHGEWKNAVVDPATGANMLVFGSGYGDGRYASYWGFDADGQVVCLITDFGLLRGACCTDCCTEVGQLHHDFPCAAERCPFCDGYVCNCDCPETVLSLSEPDWELLKRSRTRPILEGDRRRVSELNDLWNEAVKRKGRIPLRAEHLEEDE